MADSLWMDAVNHTLLRREKILFQDGEPETSKLPVDLRKVIVLGLHRLWAAELRIKIRRNEQHEYSDPERPFMP